MKSQILILSCIGTVAAVLAVCLAVMITKPSPELLADTLDSGESSVNCPPSSSKKPEIALIGGGAVAHSTRMHPTARRQMQPQSETTSDTEKTQPTAITDEAVRLWAQTDPAGTADYLLRLPSSPERAALLQALAAVWADKDPEKAATRLLKTIETSEELALAGEIAAAWVRSAPLEALTWLQTKDMPEDMRITTISHLYAEWAELAPETAAAHALLSSGDAVDETLGAVLSRWLNVSVPSALDWFQTNVEEAQRVRLVPPLAAALAQQDESAAERFLYAQEGASAWATIARDTAYALASTHPELAERLAATLDDRSEQERLFSRIRRLSVNASSGEDASGTSEEESGY